MDVITIENQAFKEIIEKINSLDNKFQKLSKTNALADQWLDIQETCELLKISKRTLQAYRDRKLIGHSKIDGKIYFKAGDIDDYLKKHYSPAVSIKK